jgi:chemotaxis signal transduction protein
MELEQSQVLRSFLIPLQGGQAILPNSSLVEVLPFAIPLKLDKSPPWVVGTTLWKTVNVPLVSLDRLIYDSDSTLDTNTRIVMVNALGSDSRLPYLGLLGINMPRVITLERAQITLDVTAGPLKPGVLSWVQVGDQGGCIPDIDAIEAQLLPLL